VLGGGAGLVRGLRRRIWTVRGAVMDQQHAPTPMVAATAGSKKLAGEDARLRWAFVRKVYAILERNSSGTATRGPTAAWPPSSAATAGGPALEWRGYLWRIGSGAADSGVSGQIRRSELLRCSSHARIVAGLAWIRTTASKQRPRRESGVRSGGVVTRVVADGSGAVPRGAGGDVAALSLFVVCRFQWTGGVVHLRRSAAWLPYLLGER
jgi:hypothetical protein